MGEGPPHGSQEPTALAHLGVPGHPSVPGRVVLLLSQGWGWQWPLEAGAGPPDGVTRWHWSLGLSALGMVEPCFSLSVFSSFFSFSLQ